VVVKICAPTLIVLVNKAKRVKRRKRGDFKVKVNIPKVVKGVVLLSNS
jgi:hypothetical protein